MTLKVRVPHRATGRPPGRPKGATKAKRAARRENPPADAREVLSRNPTREEVDEYIRTMEVEPELATFIELYKDTARVIMRKLVFVNGKEVWQRLGSVPADVFSEDYVQSHYFGGSYQFIFQNAKGEIIRTVQGIEIADPPNVEELREQQRAKAPQRDLAVSVPQSSHVDLLKLELDKRDAMFLRLVDALAQNRGDHAAAPAVSMPEMMTSMIAAMGALQNLAPKPQQSFSEKVMDKILAKAFKDAGDTDDSWLGLARDVVKEVTPHLATALNNGRPRTAIPAATSTESRPSAGDIQDEGLETDVDDDEGEETTVNISQILAHLKGKCRAGRKVAAVVDEVEDLVNGNEALTEMVKTFVAAPMAEFVAVDPELAAPHYQLWFEQLKEALSVRFVDSNGGAERPSGNAVNA